MIKQEMEDLSAQAFFKKIVKEQKLDTVFEVKEIIGQGSFGIVQLAFYLQTRKPVAIKFIHVSKILKDEYLENALANEIRHTMSIDSDHVMKIYEVYKDDEYFYIIAEYCDGGSLTTKLKSLKAKMSELEIYKILKQILEGLKQIHEKQIGHRDIKTDNLMIHNGMIKIIDLGLSKTTQAQAKTRTGTKMYWPPELYLQCDEDYNIYLMDVYALGLVLYEIAELQLLYKVKKLPDLLRALAKGPIFSDEMKTRRSKDLIDLIQRMAATNPSKRINFSEIYKHSFILKNKILEEKEDKFIKNNQQDEEEQYEPTVKGLNQISMGNLKLNDLSDAVKPLETDRNQQFYEENEKTYPLKSIKQTTKISWEQEDVFVFDSPQNSKDLPDLQKINSNNFKNLPIEDQLEKEIFNKVNKLIVQLTLLQQFKLKDHLFPLAQNTVLVFLLFKKSKLEVDSYVKEANINMVTHKSVLEKKRVYVENYQQIQELEKLIDQQHKNAQQQLKIVGSSSLEKYENITMESSFQTIKTYLMESYVLEEWFEQLNSIDTLKIRLFDFLRYDQSTFQNPYYDFQKYELELKFSKASDINWFSFL